MPFHRIVPVADIHRATWPVAEIDRDEGEVGGEDEVELKLLAKVVVVFNPLVELDPVGGLVTDFYKAPLQVVRPRSEVNKFVTAYAGVGRNPVGSRVLGRVGSIGGVEGAGKDGMAGHVLPPVVEGHAPRVGVGIAAECCEPLRTGMETEPRAVLGADRTVGGFDLGIVENGLAEKEIAIGCPHEIVQGVVRILTPEASQDDLAMIGLVVPVGVREEDEVRFLREVDSSLAEDKGERHFQVVCKNGRFVGLSVPVGIFQDDDLVVGFASGIEVWVGGRAGDPESTAGIPAHLDGTGHVGEVLLGCKAVDLKAFIDLEGREFLLW